VFDDVSCALVEFVKRQNLRVRDIATEKLERVPPVVVTKLVGASNHKDALRTRREDSFLSQYFRILFQLRPFGFPFATIDLKLRYGPGQLSALKVVRTAGLPIRPLSSFAGGR
jgi:hypothetical protein